MQIYHATKDGYLHAIYSGPVMVEAIEDAGFEVAEGYPEGFTPEHPPTPTSRWHVESRAWVDLHDGSQQAARALLATQVSRRAAYPDLAELADALYWQAQGDNTKMDAYLAAVEAVKVRFPKPTDRA